MNFVFDQLFDGCPHLGCPRPRGTVLDGGDVVAAEADEVAVFIVGGEESLLRPACGLEMLHLALASCAGWCEVSALLWSPVRLR